MKNGSVMLSVAKHLLFLIENEQKQILRWTLRMTSAAAFTSAC